ncbi:MAG: archease [Candidatus Aminicenantes bacterium]|nr:archease [Candidatus Aminicenantes bacterium]
MEKYRFLQHTADAKFQAFGFTLEEAFMNAALAVCSLMWDIDKIQKRVNQDVFTMGKDTKQLLVNFLEEILYLFDAKGFILASVKDLKIEQAEGNYRLSACFQGDYFSEKYKVYGGIKAITYNEMKIEKNNQFLVQVVVDV